MLFRNLFFALALSCATSTFGQSSPQSARADIVNAQGQKVGTATIVQAGAGVRIDLNVLHLPPGVHAIHIHAVGKCEGPDFKTAGGHLNPDTKKHGKENTEGPHAGDLANFEVGSDGTAKVSLGAEHVTLGEGPNSLFHEGGTALVVHEKADDYKTDPAGSSGARIACGLVQR